MNEAFKDEIYEMEAEQKLNDEMDEYYFSDDEELVPNVSKRKSSEEDLDVRIKKLDYATMILSFIYIYYTLGV